MSELGMKIFNKGKEEGIKEGILLEKNNTIKILLDLLDDEAISLRTKLPIEEIKELRQRYSKNI